MTGTLVMLAQAGSTAAAAAAPAAAAGNSAWLAAALILLVVGVAIGVLEIFVPSGGVLSIAAATSLIGSIACFFAYDAFAGWAALALYAAGAPVVIVLGLKVWSHTPLAKSMVLGGTDNEIGEGHPPAPAAPSLVGQVGTTITPMRPVGFIRVGDARVEAQAETGMIEPGTRVTVIAYTDAHFVVRPAPE